MIPEKWNQGVPCVPYALNPLQHWLHEGTPDGVLLGVPSLSRHLWLQPLGTRCCGEDTSDYLKLSCLKPTPLLGISLNGTPGTHRTPDLKRSRKRGGSIFLGGVPDLRTPPESPDLREGKKWVSHVSCGL